VWNGAIPVRAWPMGDAIGEGFAGPVFYRARDKIVLVVSSTLATTTAVADCEISAMVR
jgi:hypothetical protein